MVTLSSILSLAAFLTLPADSAPEGAVYVRAVTLVLEDTATAAFLGPEDSARSGMTVRVVDSLYTLDRFPFDTYPGETVVSVYKADMLRPVRSTPAPWFARFGNGGPPRGILFVARRDGESILAELFAYVPHYRSYEEYCIASDSLKFHFRITPGRRVVIAGRVRLLR